VKLRENQIRILILCHVSYKFFNFYAEWVILYQLSFLNFAAKRENPRDYNNNLVWIHCIQPLEATRDYFYRDEMHWVYYSVKKKKKWMQGISKKIAEPEKSICITFFKQQIQFRCINSLFFYRNIKTMLSL